MNKSNKSLSYSEVLKISAFSAVISIMIFFMLEVILADLLKETLIIQFSNDTFLQFVIVILGFILSFIVSILSSYLVSENIDKQFIIFSNLFAFLVNLIVWIYIAMIIIDFQTTILKNLSALEKIVVIPKILTYFSVFYLPNVTLLWIFSQITFAIFYAIFLKGFTNK